jgi:hypothetical protein
MAQQSNKGSIISMVVTIVIIGFILQVVFVYADKIDSPHKAAVEFSKAYFSFDTATMNERLCNAQKTIDDVDIINTYVQQSADKAKQRGFDLKYLKNSLYHIKTYTTPTGDGTADVVLTCATKKGINPLYTTVSRIFRLSKTSHLSKTIKVIKEDDTWKVCDKSFTFSAI